MREIIVWCNANQGFTSVVLSIISLVLSAVTIFMTVVVAKMPYKKSIKIIPGLYQENNRWVMRVTIINTGKVTLLIDSINIKDKLDYVLGMCIDMIDEDSHMLVLEPTKVYSEIVPVENKDNIFNKYGMDLNDHIVIDVHEVNGKHYKATKGFPVG